MIEIIGIATLSGVAILGAVASYCWKDHQAQLAVDAYLAEAAVEREARERRERVAAQLALRLDREIEERNRLQAFCAKGYPNSVHPDCVSIASKMTCHSFKCRCDDPRANKWRNASGHIVSCECSDCR